MLARAAAAQLDLEREQRRAASEAELLRKTVSESEAERRRVEQQQAAKGLAAAQATLLHLGSQAACASQEAGCFARKADEQLHASATAHEELDDAHGRLATLAVERREYASRCKAALFQKEQALLTSKLRLEAKKDMSQRIDELVAENDELHAQVNELRSRTAASASAESCLASKHVHVAARPF